ncbi:MAG TPA: type II secretion system minor pseudopilin GspK [Rudaea sp.]
MSGRQRGVALVIALLVVALATILIAVLLDRGELTLARTRNGLRFAQAQAYAQGLEAYAARVLARRGMQAGDSTDNNGSAWAVPLPPTPVPGGTISATMRDRNGCFNLNNLVNASGGIDDNWLHAFTLLLKALRLDPNLAPAVAAWMVAGSSATTGDDDGYYLGLPVPYRTARRDLRHVSELRLVRGIDGGVYARLAPHVCALPAPTRININTATVPVLMTLTDSMTEEQAAALWQNGQAHFTDVATAVGSLPGVKPMLWDVHSDHFLARGEIVLDGLPFTFFSLIEERNGIRILQRSQGED